MDELSDFEKGELLAKIDQQQSDDIDHDLYKLLHSVTTNI